MVRRKNNRKPHKKTIIWIMMWAYLLVLAHAFIPHHHHGSGAAFLNAVNCPHTEQCGSNSSASSDHNSDYTNQLCKNSTDAASKENSPGFETCETLKSAWLEGSKYEHKIVVFAHELTYFFNRLSFALTHEYTNDNLESKIPWLLGTISSTHALIYSRRGPPSV